ncbi:MAG: hypothetical protein IJ560_01880 [Alphaproteobacteria bacterium]|nr:hypothetical protein [Alphaproteobacteria bacterium]
MELRYITCSDPREHNSVDSIMDLLNIHPLVEVAIQAHPSKMSFGMPRQHFLDRILSALITSPKQLNFAVHVNLEWCISLCDGVLPAELYNAFHLEYKPGIPLIRRWQLNMPKTVSENFPSDTVASLIAHNPHKEFIFQYNAQNSDAIEKLNKTGVRFSVLFDASGGRGVESKIQPPVYANRPMGYSGGLSPENISDKLDHISSVSGKRNDIWIDAEGKLKDKNNKFDVMRAKQYINNAIAWQQKHR